MTAPRNVQMNESGSQELSGAAIGSSRFVKKDSSGNVIQAVAGTDKIFGITTEAVAAASLPCEIYNKPGQVVPITASTTFAINAEITATTAGKAVAASSGDWVIGTAREAATAANQIVLLDVRGFPGYIKP